MPECRTAPGYPSRSEPSYKNRIPSQPFSLPAAWRTGFCPGQFPVVCLLRPVPRLCHFQISWHPSAYPSIGNPASHKACARCGGLSRTFRPHGRGFHTPRLPEYSESGPAQTARPFWSCVYLLFPAGNPWESFCNRIHRQRQRVLSENQLPGLVPASSSPAHRPAPLPGKSAVHPGCK